MSAGAPIPGLARPALLCANHGVEEGRQMTGRDDDTSTGQDPTDSDETRDDVPSSAEGVGIGADAGSSFEPEEDSPPVDNPE